MIIKTDVKNIPLNRAPLAQSAPDLQVHRGDGGNQRFSAQNMTERLNIERSLGDALSIAQMSQNVIQRAISISLRLLNIATTAMTTGSVNSQALTEAMYDIRSTMGTFGEQVPNPVQPAAAPSAKIVEMPDIRRDLAALRDSAANMEKGEINQTEQIETAGRNLAGHMKNFRIAESRIIDIMRETTAGYAPDTRMGSGELVGRIKAAIEINPGYALSVQGNINHTTAERLMA